MRSGLSSEAAPDASLDELLAGAVRHGLTALEIRAGDAHGVSGALAVQPQVARDAARRAAAAGVSITAYRDTGRDEEVALAALSRALGTRILVDAPDGLSERLTRAERLRAAGATVAVLVHGGATVEDARAVVRSGHLVAWEADPVRAPLGETASALLRECGDALCHIRLLGGGPESAMHEGRGVGELMARLALSGFGGMVILAPSSPRFHVAWATWLGRRGGWGCGSRASETSLVTLASPAVAGDAA